MACERKPIYPVDDRSPLVQPVIIPVASLGNPIDKAKFMESGSENQAFIEAWRKAPAQWIEYKGGFALDPEGKFYKYDPGIQLIITVNGVKFHVMDSCEFTWSHGIVAMAVDRLPQQDEYNVLNVGHGLGGVDDALFRALFGKAKINHHIIELNENVIDPPGPKDKREGRGLKRWAQKTQRLANHASRRLEKPLYTIYTHEGDSGEQAEKLLQQGKKFNMIFHDTIAKPGVQKKGFNDFEHLDKYHGLSYQDTVVGLYTFNPEMTDEELMRGFTEEQITLVSQLYRYKQISHFPTKPNPNYPYLHRPNGTPIMELPGFICWGLR